MSVLATMSIFIFLCIKLEWRGLEKLDLQPGDEIRTFD